MIRRPVWARLVAFMLTLLALWLPLAIPIHLIWGEYEIVNFINGALLYSIFIILLRVWGKRVHRQDQPLQFYGFVLNGPMLLEAILGWALGVAALALLFLIQFSLGWIDWQGIPPQFSNVLLSGLITGVGVGFAEELLFRGWLLKELELDYIPWFALVVNGIIFALLHYLHPPEVIRETWPQFFGLVLLGWNLVLATWACRGRLGMAMGLHGGLVWAYFGVNIGGLIEYNGSAPEWMTGINENPIAGVLGCAMLLGLGTLFLTRIPKPQ
ncbi:CPBP family intramembrane metalloprotease [Candidatus Synechococcus calcipolaris G9]|uniref:CPBP family intramembrane metalloprotease n=1 Tax=Candidatus Synechococcus calcipolaris G9 TaxID=1497997 RepID=A0ABT6EY52_9SYNE|nr:type II CAAX endopeptidase family protein [Candidatus Synechococcus calcipolaris]MDG2989825.1 CPBP family intramembrane metalloprotease [Candidatus Synechococcus calcipolaris G9]